MTTRILDASVAVAWYVPEAASASALEWQRRMFAGDAFLVAPQFHFWEVANVLRTYVLRRELEPPDARDFYAAHLDTPICVLDPPPDEVLHLALEYRTTAYDAVYIALAVELDIPVLTAERATTPWVAKLGRLAEPL
ncbi:MAG: type II toxin-antitoxin system VapC family toxin [Planctomycetes bacterium]|nr:type II toxin-antitoxin system VapC family toxin [Planctomycetota bacterium]